MLGISTAWKSDKIKDANRLLDELSKTGLYGLELEYRISQEMYQEMKPALKKSVFKVLSIHNFFPVPDILPVNQGSGDAFRFSSEDEDERKKGIEYTKKTLQIAHDLEVRAVILHLGKVPIKTDVKKLFELYDSKKIHKSEGKNLIEKIKKEREDKRQKPLDNVLFCLEKLHKEAERLNVYIGIENRYFPDEIPNFEEIGVILKEFKGGMVKYWHDVGHAQTQEILGFEKNRLLGSYSKEMIGIHLHGASGYNDHYAPNDNIDFSSIKDYITPETIKIIEAHSKVRLEELKEGVNYLYSSGIH